MPAKTPPAKQASPRRVSAAVATRLRNTLGVDPDRLGEYAELCMSVEDAASLLDVGAAELQALLDDGDTPQAASWRHGRARARLNVRRAQFALMEKNATLAIHLGKELLGQDGTPTAGPVTFIVDTGIDRNA